MTNLFQMVDACNLILEILIQEGIPDAEWIFYAIFYTAEAYMEKIEQARDPTRIGEELGIKQSLY